MVTTHTTMTIFGSL